MLWYFNENGVLRGPIEEIELQAYVDAGRIGPETEMCSDENRRWRRADAIFEFEGAQEGPQETQDAPPAQEPAQPPPLPAAPPQPPPLPDAKEIVYADLNRNVRMKGSPGFLARLLATHDAVAADRGAAGEERLVRLVMGNLPHGGRHGYRFVRNLMLEDDSGATTQIDLVIVSAFGIFVIEAKNYKGWIFGDRDGKRWTQSLQSFSGQARKFQFQNPLHQNYRHICVLSERTGIPRNLFVSVVAFSRDAEFKTEMPCGVLHDDEVSDFVRTPNVEVIKPEQLDEIMDAFISWDQVVPEEKKEHHVEALRDRIAPASVDATDVKCPRCGAPMVLRTSGKDGNKFWGCSKYPGCRGIRKAEGS